MSQNDGVCILTISVNEAVDVPCKKSEKSSPYVTVIYKGVKRKTTVKKNESDPVWNEKLVFDLTKTKPLPNDVISIELKHYERIKPKKVLAKGSIKFSSVMKYGILKDCQVELFDPFNDEKLESTKLLINIEYKTTTSNTETTKMITQKNVDDPENLNDSTLPTPVSNTINQVETSNQSSRSEIKMNYVRRSKPRSSKAQDFQIKVTVLQGRQLHGNNIHAICRIKCANNVKYTKQNHSANPFWNETFFFSYYMSEAELFDELIEFEVYNNHSKLLRSRTLIGKFKIDIGFVYDESYHSISRKWLLLTDPENDALGARGYLKVSINVMGPGDEAPTVLNDDEDDDDVENNLLKPAGSILQPATLILKLYRAEDIPRMDSDVIDGVKWFFSENEPRKELVDPYVLFAFAGKKVQSNILYNNANPDWNQEMKIGFKFPSLCDKITITVKDWDRTSKDDLVSTLYLDMNKISENSESGFLPVFGPCFIPMYGSPREYSELPSRLEELNAGQAEGVAYRGRLLLEVQTVLGDTLSERTSAIRHNELVRIIPILQREKFKIHASFLDATMISLVKKSVEFEISIGNYGNKFEKDVLPSSSTTPPTNALFDGCSYYFLPWSDIKPYVQIASFWEDITYRLEASNYISNICKSIDVLLRSMNEAIKLQENETIEIDTKSLISIIMDKIKEIKSICLNREPIIEPTNMNKLNNLDRKLLAIREDRVQMIINKCDDLLNNIFDDFKPGLEELESHLQELKALEEDTQNSIPDIIIWMLCGDERVAYYRIPAREILYSKKAEGKGALCGKIQTITLKWPGKEAEDKTKKHTIPAQLRAKFWFGLEKDEFNWIENHSDENKSGAITIFAETYENEKYDFINKTWKAANPNFTDASGKVSLPKENFKLPNKWEWKSDWQLAPDLSSMFEKDAGHTTYIEEVYEQRSRLIPGASWSSQNETSAVDPWADFRGEKSLSKDEITIDPHWKWKDSWTIDKHRAVDNEGWEYCIVPSMNSWSSTERVYHLIKRRRWIRTRECITISQNHSYQKLLALPSSELLKQKESTVQSGWQYSSGLFSKFHLKDRGTDTVRRRRLFREMKPSGHNYSVTFEFQEELQNSSKEDRKKIVNLVAPRIFLKFNKSHRFQLRAYIYQARSLLAGDSDTSLSDPYCQVAFLTQSLKTETIQKTLSPIWDQTLIFETITIHDLSELNENPPKVTIEIYDEDYYGSPDFLGRCYVAPKIVGFDERQTALQWYQLENNNAEQAGEVLAAFELFSLDKNTEDKLPKKPNMVGSVYKVPEEIRPELERTVIEVLCWGLRQMKPFQMMDVNSPQVFFECNHSRVESEIIRNIKYNPNFPQPHLMFDLELPTNRTFIPPMNIKVIDHRPFGRKPIVGVHTIDSLWRFKVENNSNMKSVLRPNSDIPYRDLTAKVTLDLEPFESNKRSTVVDHDIDWWSKYYFSIGDYQKCTKYNEKGYEKLEVYRDELENQKGFEKFTDFCETFYLKRGKSTKDEDNEIVGEFKGTFRIYTVPKAKSIEDIKNNMILKSVQPIKKEECILRVYVIKGIDLQPKDSNGKSDPYIQILIGKQKIDNRDEYIPKTINPIFGKMFELKVDFPVEKDLIIRIKDYDFRSSDDIIGETKIDLENRLLTQHRATCGLPKYYYIAGPNQWRDSQKPSKILSDACKLRNFAFSINSSEPSVTVNGQNYTLLHFAKQEDKIMDKSFLGTDEERLCLYVLHREKFGLVPEHVETRKLYNPVQPGIEQGRIEMWVDIFPLSLGYPGLCVDVTPRRAKKHVLRCIIWNTKDVPLDDTLITGEKVSDIYVRGWLDGLEAEKQMTDVHFRSLNGDGNFNWRFTFDFEYLSAEEKIVVKKKDHFWNLDESERKIPPTLNFQIWDNDVFSPDDFIGEISLNLNAMVKPVKEPEKCGLDQINEPDEPSSNVSLKATPPSLFEQKRMKGWWPCRTKQSNGTYKMAGKIEMEIEILDEEEAIQRPAGRGRNEPNENPRLEPPKRVETSMVWFSSPFNTFKYVIWRRSKWRFLLMTLIVILVLFVLSMIYTMPSALWRKILNF